MADKAIRDQSEVVEEDLSGLPTLLDIIKNSTVVVVPDAREFTHEDAKEVLAQIKKEKGE